MKILIVLFIITFCEFVLPQEAVMPVPNQIPTPAESPVAPVDVSAQIQNFSSPLSAGFVPDEGKTVFSSLYVTSTLGADFKVNTIKAYDIDFNTGALTASVTYGLTPKTQLGLSFRNVFSGSTAFTYSPAGKAAGGVDSSTTSDGFDDPNISLSTILKENSKLRVKGNLFYEPSIGKRKKGKPNSGGDRFGLNFEFIKPIRRLEFYFRLGLVHLGKISGEASTYTYESTSSNVYRFLIGGNFLATDEISIGVAYGRNQYSPDSTKYSNNADEEKFEGYNESVFGFIGQYALDPEIILVVGANSLKSDSIEITQGAIFGTISEASGTEASIGLNILF